MLETQTHPIYALGSTKAEHERLARQAALLAPITEHFVRTAGIRSGQRVLDLGSGAGDVALLLASIVGTSGEVVGIERNAESIACARTRVRMMGLHNVTFVQGDVGDLPLFESFDAAVGRLILMFVPDPVAVVRSTACLVRPGGTVVFLEPSWKVMLALSEDSPLWAQTANKVHECLLRSGANPEIGTHLHRVFRSAGLPVPTMEIGAVLGGSRNLTRQIGDVVESMRPQTQLLGVSCDALGDSESLADRLHAEVESREALVSLIPLVGAWCTTPAAQPQRTT